MIQVEFFHDVICSFCFPMSDRMHKIANKYNNIEVIHRSFALGWTEDAFVHSFGSREAVKPEVLGHWAKANQLDDDHRFNIEGMAATDFNFPISRPALLAAKAAGLVGGQAAYWEAFDALQEALFVKNLNIEDPTVIAQVIQASSLDFDAWQAQLADPATEAAVLEDLDRARDYGVYSAPTLIIQGKYKLSGALPQATIERALAKVAEDEGLSLTQVIDLSDTEAPACDFVDGQWQCHD